MNLPELKSPHAILIAALSVFAAGWLAMYWIVDSRVSAAEANAVALNGQQNDALLEIYKQLSEINGKLGEIGERTKQFDDLQEKIEKIEERTKRFDDLREKLEKIEPLSLTR